MTSSTQLKINEGKEVGASPSKGDGEAKLPPKVIGTDVPPKKNELDVSLHSIETIDSVGRASVLSSGSSRSSSKMSLSNVMSSISSGFAKAIGRRSTFASSRDVKQREKKEMVNSGEGGGKVRVYEGEERKTRQDARSEAAKR